MSLKRVFSDKLYLFLIGCIILTASADDEESEGSSADASGNSEDGEAETVSDSICADFKGSYARRPNLGMTCCGNDTLFLPIELVDNWDTNPNLDLCTFEFPLFKDSDIPTALWNVTLCVFTNSSAFTEGNVTFDNFFKFVTDTYPDEIKEKIKKSASSCKADADKTTDAPTKLQKITECFHKSEHEVCHKPYATTEYSESVKNPKADKNECPGMEGIYGVERIDYCCKKQSIPYNFLQFYTQFPMEVEVREKQDNCSQSFTQRQMELDPKLKAGLDSLDEEDKNNGADNQAYFDAEGLLEHCTNACEILQKPYTDEKELKIDYEGTVAFMTRDFGEKIQKDLSKIVIDRKSSFKWHKANKTLTFDELNKQFEGADEISKIRFYCNFVSNIVVEVERALHEYCFDKEFADKWYTQKS